MSLQQLRQELCTDTSHYCRSCFSGKPTAALQCPPNVFRASESNDTKLITFIFDKPNNNTTLKSSTAVPIEVFDDRAGVDARLARAPSHQNLIALCRLLELIPSGSQDLHSSRIHLTNAVKCDVSSDTGKTGRIALPEEQARNCINRFLIRELEAVRSKALVFFGTNAQIYVLGTVTQPWEVQQAMVGNRSYMVMRVPHTSPQSFNTYGKRGDAYIEPFRRLLARVKQGVMPHV